VRAKALLIDIGQAIPLGLVVNELLINTFKHAFPAGRSGAVEIELEHDGAGKRDDPGSNEGLGQLTVRDNGVGLPLDSKVEETPSMGLHLVMC
jgi:two-component sensor histidine kinase